jgi:hypothetical protein
MGGGETPTGQRGSYMASCSQRTERICDGKEDTYIFVSTAKNTASLQASSAGSTTIDLRTADAAVGVPEAGRNGSRAVVGSTVFSMA